MKVHRYWQFWHFGGRQENGQLRILRLYIISADYWVWYYFVNKPKKEFFHKFVNFWKNRKKSSNRNMTTSTQILRVCSKRMVSATCTRNLTVVTSPLLFRNDTTKYSAVTGTGMSVTRTENWFKRKYNDIKNSYTQVANRVRKVYIIFYYLLILICFGKALITSSTSRNIPVGNLRSMSCSLIFLPLVSRILFI